MDFKEKIDKIVMDTASRCIRKITGAYGKRLQKNGSLPPIEKTAPQEITGEKFRLGFSREEIMPDLTKGKTYWIAGHGSGHKMEGVLTPVYVHAVWLDCGGDEGILWLSGDIVGLTNTEVEILRSRILASAVIKGARSVNFSCTHSHSGVDTVGYWGKPTLKIPADGKDPDYMELLYKQSVRAAEKAFLSRTPGALYTGRIAVPGAFSTGRKFPDMHELLTRLRFVPDDGSEETWLLNTAAHPNTLGGDNRLLSGEYPFFLREQIKAETGANVHFGVGALGGMDAADFDDGERLDRIKEQAKLFADAAENITEEQKLSPRIKFLRRQFYLPVDNNVLMLLALRGTMSSTPYPCPTSATGAATKTEMTYFDLGGQKILLLPGENFVNTVYGGYEPAETSSTGLGPEVNPMPLAEIAGDKALIVYCVSNDFTGYVVPPNDFVLHPTQPYLDSTHDRFDDNHYHETNSMGPDTQRVIAETFRAVTEDFGQ